MKFEEYLKEVSGLIRFNDAPLNERLFYYVTKLQEEAAEISEEISKPWLKVQLGKKAEINVDAIFEELGDVFWYAAALCNHFNLDPKEIMDFNINKLKGRYP